MSTNAERQNDSHRMNEMKSLSLSLVFSEGGFHEVDVAIRDVEGMTPKQLMDVSKHCDGSCTVLYHLSGYNTDELNRVLDGHSEVIQSDLVSGNEEYYLYVHLRPGSPLTELLEIVERYALLLETPIPIDEESVAPTVAGDKKELQQSVDDIPDNVDFSVQRISDYTTDDCSVVSLLTNRQREALEAAISMGYYNRPRQTTYEELSEVLNCSSSTANALLREAESRIMTSLWSL